jgi:uncharacterized membrane protein
VTASVTAMPNHADLARIVPPFVPFPNAVVCAMGVLEILCALGLVIGATRGAAVLSLAALFVLLVPANIDAALAGVPFHGGEPSPLWLRIPEQMLYIGVALWVAPGDGSSPHLTCRDVPLCRASHQLTWSRGASPRTRQSPTSMEVQKSSRRAQAFPRVGASSPSARTFVPARGARVALNGHVAGGRPFP